MDTIVLAGGKGLRLGQDKSLEKIGDRTLLERVVDSLAALGGEIIVVIAQGQSPPPTPTMATKVVVDIYHNKSALGGIYTGLLASSSFHSLVVACDMPLLNLALLRYMVELAPDYDAVIPRIGSYLEALHAPAL